MGCFLFEQNRVFGYIDQVLKILFITQKVDREDDVLGVYHEWLRRLAGQVTRLPIVCLYRGTTALPANAPVFSLGKETNISIWQYIKNFYTYIYRLRPDYDIVFVHMNPAYILLGWLPWKLWGKKIVYWNASYKISPRMKLAAWLADRRLTSVPEAFAVGQSVTAVGQGIDTELFRPDPTVAKAPNSILFLGRIAPVKNLEVLIDAVRILRQRGSNIFLDIVGLPESRNQKYYDELKGEAKDLERLGVVKFLGRVPNYQTPVVYNSHRIFVNLTESNSFDKSILEAMACGTLVLVSNTVYKNILGDLANKLVFKEKTPQDLAEKIALLLTTSEDEQTKISRQLREIVVKNHNLDQLVAKLVTILDNFF